MREPIEHQEEITPTDELVTPLQAKIGVVAALGKEFLDSHLIWNLLEGLLGVADRERHKNATRPRRNFVDIEPEPSREEYDLRRNGWHGIVVVLSEKAQIDLRKSIDRSHPAESKYAFTCADQNGIVCFISGELQTEIGFYRRADVRRTAVVNRPSSVVVLMANDLPRSLLQSHLIARSQKRVQQDVIGFKCGIGFELAAPEAFRILS